MPKLNLDGKPSKLRRDRNFSAQAPIQSGIPTIDAPSRRYVGNETKIPSSHVLQAHKGLTLDKALNRVICGDAVSSLEQLPANSCACAITSPPYWNTVDYGVPGQIGLQSYEKYLQDLDSVWFEISRVLMPNGKFCLNVPILPLRKEVSATEFKETHTRMLLDLYSDMKRHLENLTPLRLFSLYIWEKQTTEKMFGSYPYPPNLYERNYIEFIAVFVKPGPPRFCPVQSSKRRN